jgi:hypothetical protein
MKKAIKFVASILVLIGIVFVIKKSVDYFKIEDDNGEPVGI